MFTNLYLFSFPISLYFFLYLCIPVYLCLLMLASFRPLSLFTFLYLFLPHSTPSNSFYLFSTSLSTSLYLLYLCLPLCTSSLSTSFYFFLSLCTLVYPSACVCLFTDLYLSTFFSLSLRLSTSLYTYFYLCLPLCTSSFLPLFTSFYSSVPLSFYFSLPVYLYLSLPLSTPLYSPRHLYFVYLYLLLFTSVCR